MPGGYNQVGDIATHTADGRELNVVWDELQAIMADANSRRTVIEGLLAATSLFRLKTSSHPCRLRNWSWRVSSGNRSDCAPHPSRFPWGRGFSWTDKALRFSWQYPYPDIRSVLLLLIPAFLLGFVLCQACTRELGERKSTHLIYRENKEQAA